MTSAPDASVIDGLLARLRSDGEVTARALAVAALDRSGEAAVVLAALRLLGEDGGGLDRAEELGWVRRIDGRTDFDDPMIRTAAAHLVAPASRRAAHRALAAALDRPGDALARALHLADGVEVLDDDVANSVLRAAVDVARRGHTADAARLGERAAALASTAPVRTSATLHALDWWLDAGDLDGVRRAGRAAAGLTPAGLTPAGLTPAGLTPAGLTPAGLTPAGLTPAGLTAVADPAPPAARVDPAAGDPDDSAARDADQAVLRALDEVRWFCGGVRDDAVPDDPSAIDRIPGADDPRSPAHWARRRAIRSRIEAAILDGRHAPLVRDRSGLLSGLDEASRAFHRARAWRLVGDLRAARADAHRATVLWPCADHADARRLRVLVADLELLQGRDIEALSSLSEVATSVERRTPAAPSALDVELDDEARRLHGRRELVIDPTRPLSDVIDAWMVVHDGVRGEAGRLVRSAVFSGDPSGALDAAEFAERHALPIEAGEARLIAASLTNGEERRTHAAHADQQLARCGVRCWDSRIAALLATDAAVQVVERDPSLDLLTPAELRVAEAVGDGLTNRDVAAHLFLSVKTVDFHLQQIYRKLGIRSRTELMVRLTRPAAPRGIS